MYSILNVFKAFVFALNYQKSIYASPAKQFKTFFGLWLLELSPLPIIEQNVFSFSANYSQRLIKKSLDKTIEEP